MSALIAGFETSGPFSIVALGDGRSVVSRSRTGARGHVEFLMPSLFEMLEERQARLSDVEAFCVGIGPGLFTGLRVGVQTAKSLAAMTGKPLIALSSLQVLAASVPDESVVLACTQAHRGQVFAAMFERHGAITTRRTPDQVTDPGVAAKEAADHGALIAGNAAASYPEAFAQSITAVDLPSAEALIGLAQQRLDVSETDDPAAVEPNYLRRSEAEIRWGDTGVIAKRPDRVRFRDEVGR